VPTSLLIAPGLRTIQFLFKCPPKLPVTPFLTRRHILNQKSEFVNCFNRQIVRLLPEVEKVDMRHGEERYFIPMNNEEERESDCIVEIVALLENESEPLGIENYAVDCTSLQQERKRFTK
jgi:hypothetical protein